MQIMKRYWLLFSQTVTVLVAAWFVVATLQPTWLKRANTPSTVSFMQAKDDGQPGVAPGGSFRQAAQKAAPAVVSINVQQKSRGKSRRADPWFRFFEEPEDEAPSGGMGSGVIVSPEGYILTNHHVIEGAEAIEVNLNDGRRAMAKVIGTDPETDLALLKIELGQLPVIVLGQVDSLQVGDAVLAIGNPFGVGQTVTSGIVSALGRKQLGINTFENFIQTDAAINPGNSGGALVNDQGQLIGINVAIATAGSGTSQSGNIGVGFAIPSNIAKRIGEEIIKTGKASHALLGALVSDYSAAGQGKGFSSGAEVAELTKGGAAEKGGILVGDIVVKFNGKSIASSSELTAAVRLEPANAPAEITVMRSGKEVTVSLTLGELTVTK